MTVTAVTFGVTTTQTRAILAQVTHSDASYPVDPDDFADIVARKAAVVCGYVPDAGFALSDFATVTDSVAYLRCQDWAAKLAACEILRATNIGAEEQAAALCEEVMAQLRELKERPGLLGQGGGTPAQVSTVVDRQQFKTDEASRAARRDFDTLEDRTGLTDDTHGW